MTGVQTCALPSAASKSSLIPIVRRLLALHVFLCLCLYSANTERLFQKTLKTIRMCQVLIKLFDQSLPRNIRRELIQFERLIAMLIATRQNLSGYLHATKIMTSSYGKIGDINKHVLALSHQIDVSMHIFDASKVFANSSKEKLISRCRRSSSSILGKKIDSPTALGLCGSMFVACMEEIDLNISLIDDIKSRSFESFSNYLYCISLLKECSDMAKLFSKSRWSEIEGRMLFTKWI